MIMKVNATMFPIVKLTCFCRIVFIAHHLSEYSTKTGVNENFSTRRAYVSVDDCLFCSAHKTC